MPVHFQLQSRRIQRSVALRLHSDQSGRWYGALVGKLLREGRSGSESRAQRGRNQQSPAKVHGHPHILLDVEKPLNGSPPPLARGKEKTVATPAQRPIADRSG